jgi:hypothetical protein
LTFALRIAIATAPRFTREQTGANPAHAGAGAAFFITGTFLTWLLCAFSGRVAASRVGCAGAAFAVRTTNERTAAALTLTFGITATSAPWLAGIFAIANAGSAVLIIAETWRAIEGGFARIPRLASSLGSGSLCANAEDAREDAPADRSGNAFNRRAARRAARDDAR